MPERLLKRTDIAAMLGTSPGVAAAILAKAGVQPIDFGAGRCRGLRWLESAVIRAMEGLHEQAQPKTKLSTKACTPKVAGLASMSINKILELTNAPRVQ